MNSEEARDRLLHAKRSNIRGCGIKLPDKCHACDADREALAVLEADAQALADVRTLDEYVRGLGKHFGWTLSLYNAGVWGVVFTDGQWTEVERVPCLEGATPDEARAKAAAWVREQR